MIQIARKNDIDEIMQIWLTANMQAHDFIQRGYWEQNYNTVKQMLPQAMIYVYKEDKKIKGFIGCMDHFIAGIFVKEDERSKGIGKQLLDRIKQEKSSLTLQVYCKNERALRFYQREDFKIQKEQVDQDTQEREFLMQWNKIS